MMMTRCPRTSARWQEVYGQDLKEAFEIAVKIGRLLKETSRR